MQQLITAAIGKKYTHLSPSPEHGLLDGKDQVIVPSFASGTDKNVFMYMCVCMYMHVHICSYVETHKCGCCALKNDLKLLGLLVCER